jgi:CDP-6-deoxy-D-xylo-4-hexulose-3-dehydrase
MKWPLNVDNFTFLDRLKICSFILNKNNKWTQNGLVNQFELKMADFVGSKYAVFCSSGSTANTMVAMQLKDISSRNIVIFPSTTWTTSVTPFIREGFTPKFIDINLEDFSFNYHSLEKFLQTESASVAAIFVTSLLGFVPNISKLVELSHRYNVKIMFDNCENTFGKFEEKNVSSFTTSTTSTYFGHHLQSVEGGFVFTNNQQEYEYLLMLRNHGMTRSVADNEKYLNKDVDSRFDFYCLGNNFRNCEIRSLIGMLDLKKADIHIAKRKYLYNVFASEVDSSKFILPETFENRDPVPFAFPIVCKEFKMKKMGLDYCAANGIETRPIISGNLLRQTCFKKYGIAEEFPNSELLHHNGFYVGLHTKLKDNQVLELTDYLNSF